MSRPLTVLGGRKYDLRVFVRSFVPFEAYMHSLVYARVSNKVYSLSDFEVFLTVTSYAPGIAEGVRLTFDKLGPLSDVDNTRTPFADLLPKVRERGARGTFRRTQDERGFVASVEGVGTTAATSSSGRTGSRSSSR